MIIPIEELGRDTLLSIIESYVLQEGTEYGEQDVSLADKVQQVLTQLKLGEAFVVFSELHETVNIVAKNHLKYDSTDD
jgi:uncharacterized protein